MKAYWQAFNEKKSNEKKYPKRHTILMPTEPQSIQ